MLIAKKFEVPDNCPITCPFYGDIGKTGQGSICTRCPVLICQDFEYQGQITQVVHPDGFREDWAKVWSEWFKGDMKAFPVLPLFPKAKGV